MIGQNIKRLRLENNMTQKNLADKLFVTAQAVSRWENGDVEPSLSTVAELARIFGVSTDEILGVAGAEREFEEDFAEEEYAEEATEEEEKQRTYTENHEQGRHYEERPQMLALCEKCNNPIYKPEDIFRFRDEKTGAKGIRCRACESKVRRATAERAKKLFEDDMAMRLKKSKRARVKNIITACILTAISIWLATSGLFTISTLLGVIGWQCLIGSVLFRNTKIGRVMYSITCWHEFSDFDFGILNLGILIVDVVLWVLCVIIAMMVGTIISPVFYVISIVRNIKHPERIMLHDFWED